MDEVVWNQRAWWILLTANYVSTQGQLGGVQVWVGDQGAKWEGAGSAKASACEVLGQARLCLQMLPVVICVSPLGCIVFRAEL